jgi:AcrR family transcriptional regulator
VTSRKQSTQDSIVEAAYQLFAEKGFDRATTKEIAERAGVAELTVFRHFQNKHNIFQQVLLRYSPASYIEEALAEIEKMPFREGFYRLTQILVDHLQKNRNIIRLNLMETAFDAQFKNAVNPVRRKVLNHILAYFKQWTADGTLPGGFTLEEVAHTYLWSIFSTIVLFDSEKMDIIQTPAERMCDVIFAIFLQSFRSGEGV